METVEGAIAAVSSKWTSRYRLPSRFSKTWLRHVRRQCYSRPLTQTLQVSPRIMHSDFWKAFLYAARMRSASALRDLFSSMQSKSNPVHARLHQQLHLIDYHWSMIRRIPIYTPKRFCGLSIYDRYDCSVATGL